MRNITLLSGQALLPTVRNLGPISALAYRFSSKESIPILLLVTRIRRNLFQIMSLLGFAPILETPRLMLILFDVRNPLHHDESLAILNHPKVTAIMGESTVRTHAQNNRLLRSTSIYPNYLPPNLKPRQDEFPIWLIYLKPEVTVDWNTKHKLSGTNNDGGVGHFIGVITIGQRSIELAPDMGWAVLPSFWNQGFATEAGREVFRYATQELGLHKLIAFPLETNVGSIRTARKIGFVDGGEIRDVDGRQHLVFLIEGMKWTGKQITVMDLKGRWTKEEEVCPCSRCEEGEKVESV